MNNIQNILQNRDKMMHDLLIKMRYYVPVEKDICIVIHNGLDYVQKCLDSIFRFTEKPYKVHVWDNASNDDTRNYLMDLASQNKINYYRHTKNLGFIEPANELAAICTSPFVILINSDVEVLDGWDKALLSQLIYDNDLAQVGFQGGVLNSEGIGTEIGHGYDVDYICGWCFAIRKEYCFPLFDSHNLSFAYGEDSDLSLRLREQGKKIYSLHLELAVHHENITVKEVAKNSIWKEKMVKTFEANHAYIRKRWSNYLGKYRIGLQDGLTRV